MLILAGVSINAIVGDNGVISKAQQASFANKLATYNEEFEMNAVGAITDEDLDNRDKITLMNEYVKQYVPSLEDNDIGQFAIINGQLYYVGDEELEREVCKSQGYNTLPEGMTAEEFASSVESSAVEDVLKNMIGDAFYEEKEDGTNGKVGVALANKVAGTFGSTQPWKIITEIENGEIVATYGAGWYFVENGSTIEGIGTLKNSYIIDYTNRKAVKFDATKHTILYNGSNLAVTDGLVYNADPTNMGDGSAESWGNATLHNFNTNSSLVESLHSGWTPTALYFDGVDDCISVSSTDCTFINGFTVEIYASIDNKSGRNFVEGLFNKSEDSGLRILAYPQGVVGISSMIHGFCFRGNSATAVYPGDPWQREKDFYLTIVYDNSNKEFRYYRETELIKRYPQSTASANETIQLLNDGSPFVVGRSKWFADFDGLSAGDRYLYGRIYSVRMFNEPLIPNEIKANYNATVSYHNILVNGGNASTGGNTGGEDIGTIE